MRFKSKLLWMGLFVLLNYKVLATDYVKSESETTRHQLNGEDTMLINTDVMLDSAGATNNFDTDNATVRVDPNTSEESSGHIINNGTISTDRALAIYVGTDDYSITNNGTISAPSDGDNTTINSGALFADKVDNFSLINNGIITSESHNLGFGGVKNATLINNKNGRIHTEGEFALFLGDGSPSEDGSSIDLHSAQIINHGEIISDNHKAVYVVSSADDGYVNLVNYGSITGGGLQAIDLEMSQNVTLTNHGNITGQTYGIELSDTTSSGAWISGRDGNNTIINHGSISSVVEHAIVLAGGDTLINYGSINTAASSEYGVLALGDNNTITLGVGSTISSISFEGGTNAINNRLNVSLGPGISYAYDINTSSGTQWTLTDLDGKLTFQSDTQAIGIDVASSNAIDELVTQRAQSLNQSLARYYRHPRYQRQSNLYQSLVPEHHHNHSLGVLNLAEQTQSNTPDVYAAMADTQDDNLWSDIYLSEIDYGGDATHSNYDNRLMGITLIQPKAWQSMDLIANYQQGKLEVGSGDQYTDSRVLSLGLHQPKSWRLGEQDIFVRGVLSRGSHDTQRKVMGVGNAGSTTYDSDYNSTGLSLAMGTQLKQHIDGMDSDFDLHLEAELNHERIDSYSEGTDIHWEDRALTQLSLSAQTLWQKQRLGTDYYLSTGIGMHRLLSGEDSDYLISGNTGTYRDDNTQDISLSLGIGAKHNLDDNTQFHGGVELSKSKEDIDTITASVGWDWRF